MTDLLDQWADGASELARRILHEEVATDSTFTTSFEEKLRVIGAGVFSLPLVSCTNKDVEVVMESTYGLVTSFSEDPHQFAEALLFCAVQKKAFGENVMSMGAEMLSYVKELVAVYAEALTDEPISAPSTPQKGKDWAGAGTGDDDAPGSCRPRISISAPNTPGTNRQSFTLRRSISLTSKGGAHRRGSDNAPDGGCTACLAKELVLAERLRTLNEKYIQELADAQTIDDLTKQVEMLQATNSRLLHLNQEMESTVTLLGKQAEASEAHILQLDHQIIALEKAAHAQKQSHMQDKADAFNIERERLLSKVDSLAAEGDELRLELKKHHSSEMELNNLKDDLQRCEKELSGARADLEEAVSHMREAEDAAAVANKQAATLREQQASDRIKAEAVAKEFKSTVDSHDTQYMKLLKENREMKTQIEGLRLERTASAGVSAKQARKQSILELHESIDLGSESDGDVSVDSGGAGRGENGSSSGRKKKSTRNRSVKLMAANVFAMELEIDKLQTEVKMLNAEIVKLSTPLTTPTKISGDGANGDKGGASPSASSAASAVETTSIATPSTTAEEALSENKKKYDEERAETLKTHQRRVEKLEKEVETSVAVIAALRRDLKHSEALLLRLYESGDVYCTISDGAVI